MVALAGRHDSFPSGRGLACRAETDVALTLSSVLRSAFARRAFVAGSWAPMVGEVTSRRKGTFGGGPMSCTSRCRSLSPSSALAPIGAPPLTHGGTEFRKHRLPRMCG